VLRERHEPGAIQPTDSISDLAGSGTATRASAQSFASPPDPSGESTDEFPTVAEAPGRFNPETPGGSGVKKMDGYGQSTGYLPGPLESGPPVFVGPKTLHVFAVPFHSAIPPSDPGNVKLYCRGANTRPKSPCGFEGMGDVLGL